MAIILVSLFTRNIHLDTDMVLLGELAFAPFNRLVIAGRELGPLALWVMSGLLILNGLLVMLFYKELTVSLFDPDFSSVLQQSPTFFYYGLMFITSITAVGAFDVVGSLVVVALMIVPAATASLLAHRLIDVITISLLVAMSGAVGGCGLAIITDASIAGSIAVVLGILFLCALFGAPYKGIFSRMLYFNVQRKKMDIEIVCAYLIEQPGEKGITIESLAKNVGWSINHTTLVCQEAERERLLTLYGNKWSLAIHDKK